MAGKEQEKKKGGAPGGGAQRSKDDRKQKAGDAGAQKAPHAGAELPAPPPRLRDFYQKNVRAKLMQQFSLSNPHEVPALEKIVVNVGFAEAISSPSCLTRSWKKWGLSQASGRCERRRRSRSPISDCGRVRK
jgi:large subunit ribosomal protein L5